MTQLLIDDFLPGRGIPPPAPFQPHSATSRAAAEAIEPHLNRLQFEVLTVLSRAGEAGLTDEELQRSTGLNPSTERPRRIELVESGLAQDSGEKRPTASGRNAVVWRITDAGRELLELF